MNTNHPDIKERSASILGVNVIVSALGYFVDIYDLLLFGIVRVASLKSIGVADKDLLEKGVFLINAQMAGMLIGGIFWGVLGDKKGRISVLFGSILMYSLANIANAFVTSVEMYGVLRFIAGVGLAGELGAAITLVSETLSKENRGIGTTIVAGVGLLGAVVAGLVGDIFSWQTSYIIGGVLGLCLLGLRVSMYESGIYKNLKESKVSKGDLRMLISPPSRFLKYVCCILIGAPLWYVVGILITFSPELGAALSVDGALSAGKAIMWCYGGIAIGDIASGFVSQYFRSRRKAVLYFLILESFLCALLLRTQGLTADNFYLFAAVLGFGVGYWAVFVTIAAEQFGTNIRATVAITVPNFVRGALVPMTLGYQSLIPSLGLVKSAAVVGAIMFALAFIALYFLKETFGKDLNYLEE